MEITGNDLRIGNWVKDHTGLNNVIKMIGVGWVKFIDDEACAFDLCSGIPLTEELLLKMGFELNPDAETDAFEKYKHKTIKGFTLEMFNNEGWVINGLDQWLTPEPFKYLHQLQNKFYFSTDLELTLS